MIEMTHEDLVVRAEDWLKRMGCGITFREYATNTHSGEIPDAIGWRDHGDISIVVECKVSRSDFLADRGKPFRQQPETGMGNWRFYLCPKGLIQPDEVPAGWGLLWVSGKTIRSCKRMPQNSADWANPPFKAARLDETRVLVSALRRLHIRGVFERVYDRLSVNKSDDVEGLNSVANLPIGSDQAP